MSKGKRLPIIESCRQCPYVQFEPAVVDGNKTHHVVLCRLALLSAELDDAVLVNMAIPNDKGVRMYDKLGDALRSIPAWCPL